MCASVMKVPVVHEAKLEAAGLSSAQEGSSETAAADLFEIIYFNADNTTLGIFYNVREDGFSLNRNFVTFMKWPILLKRYYLKVEGEKKSVVAPLRFTICLSFFLKAFCTI